jgi:hypothetical protein
MVTMSESLAPASASVFSGFPAANLFMVKERVNAIALAPVEEFPRDSDLFGESVRKPETQNRLQAALNRGFQTRDAEMNLARFIGELSNSNGERDG